MRTHRLFKGLGRFSREFREGRDGAFQRHASFFGRIDGNADAAVASVLGGPHRQHQIIQADDGTARGDADDVGIFVNFPALAGARQDDVVLFGIEEDELNSLNAGEKQNFFREVFAILALGNGIFNGPQRNHPHADLILQSLRLRLHGLEILIASQGQVLFGGHFQESIRRNKHATDCLAEKAVVANLSLGAVRQQSGHCEQGQ